MRVIILLLLCSSLSAQTILTEYTTTVKKDGKNTFTLSCAPLNYNAGTYYAPVDESTIADAGGFYRQCKTLGYRVRISSLGVQRYYPSSKDDTKYLEIGMPEINVLGSWSKIAFTEKATAGSKVTIGNTDFGFEYVVNSAGIKTKITIGRAIVVRPVRWAYTLVELEIAGKDNADFLLYDKEECVGKVLRPYVNESSTGTINTLMCEWSKDDSYLYMTLPDLTGLTFPIYVDPTVVYSTQPTPGQDCYTLYDSSTNNYGSTASLRLGAPTSADTYKRSVGLIKFDLTVLAGNTINSATFYTYNSENNWRDRGTIRAHRIKVANDGWVAGTADGTPLGGSSVWAAKISGAGEVQWAGNATRGGCSVSGTDYEAVALGTATIGNVNWTGGEEVAMGWNTTELTSMVSGNYGFAVICSAGNSYFQCGSADNGTATWRPKLVVTYTTANNVGFRPRVIQVE